MLRADGLVCSFARQRVIFSTHCCLCFCEEIIGLLDDIERMSYPQWLADNAPFLPPLNLRCISTGGKSYLNDTEALTASASQTLQTVAGFTKAIVDSCSEGFGISGGYNTTAGKLALNIAAELGDSANL